MHYLVILRRAEESFFFRSFTAFRMTAAAFVVTLPCHSKACITLSFWGLPKNLYFSDPSLRSGWRRRRSGWHYLVIPRIALPCHSEDCITLSFRGVPKNLSFSHAVLHFT